MAKRTPLLIRGLILSTFLTLSGVAAADTSYGDWQQSFTLIPITGGTDTEPTRLAAVTVRCPTDGFLMATGHVRFRIFPEGAATAPTLLYSLSLTGTVDTNHLVQATGAPTAEGFDQPGSIARLIPCKAGAPRAVWLVARRVGGPERLASTSSYAASPRLFVVFIQQRI
jgi:hypothetical protein